MGATVTSLIMSEGAKPRCVGVRCSKGGKTKTYMAEGEEEEEAFVGLRG